MEEMKIFIINLDNPELDTASAWVSLPCATDTIKEKIGLPENSEHYLISDFVLPFEITQEADLEAINDVCESIINSEIPFDDIREIQKKWFKSLYELEFGLYDITRYEGCSTMEEVATFLINECGELGEVSTRLYPFIDYQGYANVLEELGSFLNIHNRIYEHHE